MGPDRRSLPQPELGVSPVARERGRENYIAIVSGAGEKRHHGDFVRLDLIENPVEAGLTLMKCDGHLVEEPATSQLFRGSAHQRVCGRLPARAMGSKNQCPASIRDGGSAHRPTWSCTRS